jgi:DNA-binding beta-propeller fold protein YncE
METQLLYDLSTDPFPVQASPNTGDPGTVNLTIVGWNPNPSVPVTLKGVSIKLLVGADATDLTNIAPTAIDPPVGWSLTSTNKGSGSVEYVFTPQSGQGTISTQRLVFAFTSITVNSEQGTTEVTVKEGSAGGNATLSFPITKFPNGWGAVNFSVSPADISKGDSTTLSWSGPQGATYTIEYSGPGGEVINIPAQGQPALGSDGQYPAMGAPPLTLDSTTVFTLNVSDTIEEQSYQAQEQKTVTVDIPPPTITLFTGELQVSGTTVILNLSWDTTNADTCSLSGDPHPLASSSPAGGYQISPTLTSPLLNLYTLTAENSSGQVSSQLAIQWGSCAASVLVGTLPTGIAASPDNTRILIAADSTGNTPSTLTALDPSTLEPLGNQPAIISCRPYSLAYSHDGSKILVGTEDGNITILNTWNLQPYNQPIPVGDRIIQGVAVSPDGARIYVTNWTGGAIIVFDAKTYAPIGQPVSLPNIGSSTLPMLPYVYGIAVSTDSSRVFVCYDYLLTSAGVYVYESTNDPANPLQPVGSLAGVEGLPTGVAVSPDGLLVFVAAQSTNTIQMFDASTLQPVGLAMPSAYGLYGIAASPDGSRIYVTGPDTNDPVSVYVPSGVTGGTGN